MAFIQSPLRSPAQQTGVPISTIGRFSQTLRQLRRLGWTTEQKVSDVVSNLARLTNSHFARQRKRLSSVMPIKARSPKNPFNYRSCRGGNVCRHIVPGQTMEPYL